MKQKIIIAMVVAVMAVTMLGCGAKSDAVNDVADDIANNDVATSVDENEEVPDETANSDFSDYTVTLDITRSDNGKESGHLETTDGDGNVIWTYDTDSYDMTELDAICEIGSCKDMYFLSEAGNVIAFNLTDGSVKWMNEEFGGFSVTSFIDESREMLYLCGYYGPNFCAVDFDGNTKTTIDDSEYYWPYEIFVQDDYIYVKLDGSQDEMQYYLQINPEDYSYEYVAAEDLGMADEPSNDANDPALDVEPMDHIVDITASSELSEKGVVYSPSNICDGDMSTAWVEGSSDNGVGQSVTITFDQLLYIHGIKINAGYQKSSDLFNKNAAPSVIRLSFSDGSYTEYYDVNATEMTQTDIPVGPLLQSDVTIEIMEVRGGSKYQDCCISEVEIY